MSFNTISYKESIPGKNYTLHGIAIVENLKLIFRQKDKSSISFGKDLIYFFAFLCWKKKPD